MQPSGPRQTVRFGPFEGSLQDRELRKQGIRVTLQAQPFAVLECLLARPGELVTRDELRLLLWPNGTFVDFDKSLNTAVMKLREALGDSAQAPLFVETVGRHGYRFIAHVETQPPITAPTPLSAETASTRVSRRTVVVGLALLAPLLVAAVAWQVWRSRQPDAGPIRSLAVLPFANLSSDPEQEYLADGITDALITELAGIRSLRVISRQSVIRYKENAKPMPEIARELGVDGIVEGAVHRSGSRVRVSVQVVHGSRDEHLWARSFEGEAGDMFALQAEIARAVANGVRVKLTAPEQARFARAADADVDPEAYDLYLRGRYFYNRLLVDDMETVLLKCVSYQQQAVQKDPRFAAAHASLAWCHFPLAYFGLLPPWEATPRLEKHARKALELDPDLAEGHLALAGSFFLQFDWAGADVEFRKAIESNPGDAQIRQMYCFFLFAVGRFEESLSQSAQGLRIDPFYPWLSMNHASALFELGRVEEALAEARQIVEIDSPTQAILGVLYLRLGREQEALAEFERIGWDEGIARIRGLRGDASGLRSLLARLQERAQQRYVSPIDFAVLLTALGEKDAAFARLEEAYRTKATRLHSLKTSWNFRPLRSDPRWSDLVHRLKLG